MSLTKATYSMTSGAVINVLDYGAVGNGVRDDTADIQAALDAGSGVFFPEGNYKITAPLQLNTDNFVFGESMASVITATHAGAMFKGKGVTPSSGTNVRRYRGGGRDIKLVGAGKAVAGTIALDMRGCTQFKWFNTNISEVEKGVFQGDNYSSYYNEYHAVDIRDVGYGYYNTTLGNENAVFGGRIDTSTVGTYDSDNSHSKYFGLAIENFTTGHQIASPASQYITYVASRLENLVLGGTGVLIDATAQATFIFGLAAVNLSPAISDSGSGTNFISDAQWKINGGSSLNKYFRVTATLNFPSISAGASTDIAISAPGMLPTDSAFVTPPATLEAGLIAMAVPSSNQVYVRLANVTGSPIDPASATFTVDIWKH